MGFTVSDQQQRMRKISDDLRWRVVHMFLYWRLTKRKIAGYLSLGYNTVRRVRSRPPMAGLLLFLIRSTVAL